MCSCPCQQAAGGRTLDVAPVLSGQVGPPHLLPHLEPLRRRGGRVLEDEVLEVVHGDAVGQEEQRFREVDAAEALGVVAEELLHVRPGQELEAHRVDLGRLDVGQR